MVADCNREKSNIDKATTAAVGLRIITQQHSEHNQCSNSSSNIVIKSCNLAGCWRIRRSGKSSFSINICGSDNNEYYSSKYFLKFCCLCKKKLKGDREVYMYKGDQGFCSVDCRNRQIYLDDIADLEASTKKLLSSFAHCSSDNNAIFEQDFHHNYSSSGRSQRARGLVY